MQGLDERSGVVETAHGSVQVAREGSGPRVMVLHGAPGGFDQGLSSGRHLRDGGCELIAPSRPGYLRTPLDGACSPAQQADLFAAMLDALDLDEVTVLGVSSGGPSAVHFAARHPERTKALLLDSAVLLPFEQHLNVFERAISETRFGVWLSFQIARKWPKLMTTIIVDAFSNGLEKDQKQDAVDWIASDSTRLQQVEDLMASVAPRRYRAPGQTNDERFEVGLDPLPFGDVAAPTLVAHGTHDGLVPLDHSKNAATKIPGAELILVEEGHHALPLSRGFGPVGERQLELALG